MTTTLQKKTSDYLLGYSVDVTHWDSEMGDTDQMLGRREILGARQSDLLATELAELHRLDQQVLRLADAHQLEQGWDVLMLQKTADLIRAERACALIRQAA